MTYHEAQQAIDDAARVLGEHFDAVVVLACVSDCGDSTMVSAGSGSWYAQHGMLMRTVSRQHEERLSEAIAEQLLFLMEPDDL